MSGQEKWLLLLWIVWRRARKCSVVLQNVLFVKQIQRGALCVAAHQSIGAGGVGDAAAVAAVNLNVAFAGFAFFQYQVAIFVFRFRAMRAPYRFGVECRAAADQ